MSQKADPLPKDKINRLIEGGLSWEELRNEILPDPKDAERFRRVREVLEERVDWDEPILVPLNDHLFAVGKDGERIVKAECGAELGLLDDNWKKHCRIRVRESEEEMTELYPKWMTPDPDWTFQLREFFCPQCFQQVDVEAVPAGYPIIQSFEPDIDTFYEEWLGMSPPDKHEK